MNTSYHMMYLVTKIVKHLKHSKSKILDPLQHD